MQRPNDARARPSSLISKDDDYNQIFDSSHPVELFRNAAALIKAVQSKLRSRDDLLPKDRNNLLFYVAMFAACLITNKSTPTVKDLASVAPADITDEVTDRSIEEVKKIYDRLGGTDQVAKGTTLVSELKKIVSTMSAPRPAVSAS